MSPRRNWDSPNPWLTSECAPPPITGEAHSPAGEGLGESQFRRLEKKHSTLPTLCYRLTNVSNVAIDFYFLFTGNGRVDIFDSWEGCRDSRQIYRMEGLFLENKTGINPQCCRSVSLIVLTLVTITVFEIFDGEILNVKISFFYWKATCICILYCLLPCTGKSSSAHSWILTEIYRFRSSRLLSKMSSSRAMDEI